MVLIGEFKHIPRHADRFRNSRVVNELHRAFKIKVNQGSGKWSVADNPDGSGWNDRIDMSNLFVVFELCYPCVAQDEFFGDLRDTHAIYS